MPEWAQSSQGQEKNAKKKRVTLTWKFPWKSCSTTRLLLLSYKSKILNVFLKTFPSQQKKPTKFPEKLEQWGKKWEKRGEERKRKVKVKTAWLLGNPILLSAHARTSQANILHLDQNAAKCTTCKWLYGTFYFFTARHGDQGTSRLPSKRVSAKFPGVNGLKVAGFENLKERLNSVEKFLVTVLYYILANFIFEMTVFPSLSPFQGLFCVSVLSQ